MKIKNKVRMFGVAVLILVLITAVILGLVVSPGNPLTWLLIAALVLLPILHRRLNASRFIEWKPEYSVGIESIDNQHRKLIGLINALQTAVDYSTGEEFERQALEELVDYTRTHFKYEEGLMEQNGYPDFEPHRAEHERMIAQVDEVMEAYRQDQDNAMRNAITFLKGWLVNHINGTDQQYSKFLIDKGVK
jgi:hemerythrin-like metal-binding protein